MCLPTFMKLNLHHHLEEFTVVWLVIKHLCVVVRTKILIYIRSYIVLSLSRLSAVLLYSVEVHIIIQLLLLRNAYPFTTTTCHHCHHCSPLPLLPPPLPPQLLPPPLPPQLLCHHLCHHNCCHHLCHHNCCHGTSSTTAASQSPAGSIHTRNH